MTPDITVAIPFFNEERFLGAAIASVLRQTHTSFELLLVDDGSTDGSLAVARSFRDSRVRVVADGRRRHLPARLNEVAHGARGKWVARMDGDDLAHPRRLARQLELAHRSDHVDAIGTWAALVDDAGVPLCVIETDVADVTPRLALERGLLVHASTLARRDWLRANPYDEALTRTEDRDLWVRTAATSRFDVVPEVLYVIRTHRRRERFLPRYVESQRQNRALFLRHGPRVMGWSATLRAWVVAYGKEVAMRAAARFGVQDRFVRRRGRLPDEGEKRLIEEALAVSEPTR